MTTHIDQLHHRLQFVDERGQLTPFAFKFLANLWERVGGPDDAIEELERGELYEPGTIDGLLTETKDQLDELENLVNEKDSLINDLHNRIEVLESQIETLLNHSLIDELNGKVNDLETKIDSMESSDLDNNLKRYALSLS